MTRDFNQPQPATGAGTPPFPAPHQHQRQRWMRLGAKIMLVTAACGALLFLSVWLLDALSPGMPWRALIALLPMLALALFLWLFIGLIRSFDERVQRIELLAIISAAFTVAALWFAAGLLHAAGVIAVAASQALFLVLPGLFLAYGAAKLILMWRDLWGHS